MAVPINPARSANAASYARPAVSSSMQQRSMTMNTPVIAAASSATNMPAPPSYQGILTAKSSQVTNPYGVMGHYMPGQSNTLNRLING